MFVVSRLKLVCLESCDWINSTLSVPLIAVQVSQDGWGEEVAVAITVASGVRRAASRTKIECRD
jgi:hypothetical protein